MFSVISMLVNRLIGDTLLSKIIMLFIANCLNYGDKLAEPTLKYIQQAAGLPLTNTEKAVWVATQLKADFPGIGTDFLKTVVEATYDQWKASNAK